jgi:hypothetical protein
MHILVLIFPMSILSMQGSMVISVKSTHPRVYGLCKIKLSKIFKNVLERDKNLQETISFQRIHLLISFKQLTIMRGLVKYKI